MSGFVGRLFIRMCDNLEEGFVGGSFIHPDMNEEI